MKRSEMVKLIHNNVSKVLKTKLEFDRQDCDRLLREMECSGMIPPDQYCSIGEHRFEWEPEDED